MLSTNVEFSAVLIFFFIRIHRLVSVCNSLLSPVYIAPEVQVAEIIICLNANFVSVVERSGRLRLSSHERRYGSRCFDWLEPCSCTSLDCHAIAAGLPILILIEVYSAFALGIA